MAQPLSPEQREQPGPRERREQPGQGEQHEQPGQAEQHEQPGPREREALLDEPPGRPLLQEPPERPATGVRRAPVVRGRRGAGGTATEGADWDASPLPSRGAGWTIISYLIAGMIAYGAIGWLVSRALHETAFFPVGMLFGLGVSIGLVIYRYGRSSSTLNEHAKETLREERAGDR